MDNKDIVAIMAAGIGKSGNAEKTVTVPGSSPTIAAMDNTLYVCSDAVTVLTVSALPESGLFEIVFQSGATAPDVSLPSSVILPDGLIIETSTIYDMSIRVCAIKGITYGLATVQGWPLPATN